MSNLVWLIPVAPLIATLIGVVLCFSSRGRQSAHLPTWLGLMVSAVVCLMTLMGSDGGTSIDVVEGYQWLSVGQVTIPISVRLDGVGLVQLTVVTCISLLVAIYAQGYMKGDPGYPRFFTVLSAFVFSMVMLVLSSNLLVLYAFWEGVGLCSYLLIGYWYQKPSAANAAMKAFLVNRLADTAFLAGILLLWWGVGKVTTSTTAFARLDFDTIFDVVPALAEQYSQLTLWIGFLLLIGAIGKSAQFPFHVWLPDAMEGPTPVSALIHAATMVTAGVYLLARMSPLLQYTPEVLQVAGWLGAITAVIGGLIALFQDDLKRVLAYSTVSQLGLLFIAFGAGLSKEFLPFAVVAAMFHLLTHAFFKALLFLTAGNVMHAMGDVIDMRRFSGLKSVLPTTHWLFLVGALALAGVPPLAGFWSKEGIFGLLAVQLKDPQHGTLFLIWLCMGLFSSLLTATYTFRAYMRTFLGPLKTPAEAGHHPHEATPGMLAPLYVLAIGSVLSGVALFLTSGLNKYILPMPFMPETLEAPHGSWWLIAVSLGIVVGGYALAKAFPNLEGQKLPSYAQVLASRLYIDELFYYLLVWPAQGIANILGAIDKAVDGMIRGIANVPTATGSQLRRMQAGVVSSYALTMAVGIVVLVALAFL
ncbi:MAG: NADH-quinone oxidoreductase subunit L [Pirellulales bacterium]